LYSAINGLIYTGYKLNYRVFNMFAFRFNSHVWHRGLAPWDWLDQRVGVSVRQ